MNDTTTKRDRLHQSIKAASAILTQSDCTVCQQALAELESEVERAEKKEYYGSKK